MLSHADLRRGFDRMAQKYGMSLHDNYGSALAAYPGESQGRPDNDLGLSAYVCATACPRTSSSRCPVSRMVSP
jgi:hypothetical protein